MNYAIILAAGVGQRMRSGGLPKQFLKLMGKPIIIYTLERFDKCEDIDKIIVVSHGSYVEYMSELINQWNIKKVESIVVGGSDRQSSLRKGLDEAVRLSLGEDVTVLIHDGVRPLISETTIRENIRVVNQYGCALTVHQVTESVVVTDSDEAGIDNFEKRQDTFSLTSPQSFKLSEIVQMYKKYENESGETRIPLLDAAMIHAHYGEKVHLVKEQGANIKITTPEDFYMLKALIELEENKHVFGL